MVRHSTADHRMLRESRWVPDEVAERVSDRIWTSHGVTDSHLVTTDAGDVVINTGFASHGARHRQRYEEALGRPLDVRTLVFTQAYYEQIGGWEAFVDPGVEVIAHRYHDETIHDQEVVETIHGRRAMRVLAAPHAGQWQRRAADGGFSAARHDLRRRPTFLHRRRSPFRPVVGARRRGHGLPRGVGARRASGILGKPGGRLARRAPNLYTLRGARLRSAWRFIEGMERIRDLDAEIHLPGHGPVITGAAHVRQELQKVIDAVRYIHDRTVDGMNAGVDMWTLMREVRLPADLELRPGRCPTHWLVRSVWEDYIGWARMESTTELYGVPPQSVWSDLVELAGGPAVLTERAQHHAAHGEPLRAIHLTDIVLSIDPRDPLALDVHLAAHEALLDAASDSFDELGYLETEIARGAGKLGRG